MNYDTLVNEIKKLNGHPNKELVKDEIIKLLLEHQPHHIKCAVKEVLK